MQQYRLVKWRQLLRQKRSQYRRLRQLTKLRHSRSRALKMFSTTVVSIAWLLMPLMLGCNRAETGSTSPIGEQRQPEAANPNSHQTCPSSAGDPAPNATWSLRFTGLANQYHGASRSLPNNQLVHQKESNE